MEQNKEYKGLGGWLILVGIGVVIAPIKLLVTTVPVFNPIFTDGTWEVLTTVGTDAYSPIWAPLLISEIIYNIAMFIALLYLVFLFFSKHYRFPVIYIIILVIPLLFIPLDAWFVTLALPNEPMFDPETSKEFFRVLLTGLIWVPYMLISKRVKVTFVEKLPNKKTSLSDES